MSLVIIIPFSVVNGMSRAVNAAVIGVKSSVCKSDVSETFCSSDVGASSSNVMSVNTGVKVGVLNSFADVSLPNSKSLGNGNSPAGCNSGTVALGTFDPDVIFPISNLDFGAVLIPARARAYNVRISDGNPGGSGRVYSSDGAGVVLAASTSGVATGVGGISAFTVSAGTGDKNFGNDIFINGALLRMTINVVAIYSGNAAKIIMPKTKPGNPCNWAWASLTQCAPENILKLNIQCKIAHIIRT